MSNSDHESAPLVMKRKRSENFKRPQGSSINPALSSDEDDQQAISKMIKIKYYQGPSSKVSTSANPTLVSIDSTSLTILPTPTPPPILVVELQDSNDDMGLKTDIFDLMALLVQATQTQSIAQEPLQTLLLILLSQWLDLSLGQSQRKHLLTPSPKQILE